MPSRAVGLRGLSVHSTSALQALPFMQSDGPRQASNINRRAN